MSFSNDITFADIVNGPTLNFSQGNWGTVLLDRLDELTVQWRYGLLAINRSITVSTSPTIILTAPSTPSPGFACLMDRVFMYRRGSTPPTALVTIGTQSGTPNNWHDGFSATGLTSDDFPLVIPPHPGSDILGSAPGVIPVASSAVSGQESYRIERITGSSFSCDILAFGYAWRIGD